jgi:hypothetical protein
LLTDANNVILKKRQRMNRIKQMRGETNEDFDLDCGSHSLEATLRGAEDLMPKLSKHQPRFSTSQPSTPTNQLTAKKLEAPKAPQVTGDSSMQSSLKKK